MADSSSDVTSTLKRKPSSVSSTNSEDSPVVGKPKPNKQEKKKQRFVSEELTDGEEENEQNMESTVTTLDVLSKKLDSLATKDDIDQFRAEIQRVIDSLHNKVDKMESRVFDVEAEKDKLKTEIRKIQENNKDLKTTNNKANRPNGPYINQTQQPPATLQLERKRLHLSVRFLNLIFKIIIFVFRFFDGTLPPYLSSCLSVYTPSTLRSSSDAKTLSCARWRLNPFAAIM